MRYMRLFWWQIIYSRRLPFHSSKGAAQMIWLSYRLCCSVWEGAHFRACLFGGSCTVILDDRYFSVRIWLQFYLAEGWWWIESLYSHLWLVDSQLFESEKLDTSLCSQVILWLILLVLIYPDSEETLLGGFSMVEIFYYLLQVVYFYEIYFWDLCLL